MMDKFALYIRRQMSKSAEKFSIARPHQDVDLHGRKININTRWTGLLLTPTYDEEWVEQTVPGNPYGEWSAHGGRTLWQQPHQGGQVCYFVLQTNKRVCYEERIEQTLSVWPPFALVTRTCSGKRVTSLRTPCL